MGVKTTILPMIQAANGQHPTSNVELRIIIALTSRTGPIRGLSAEPAIGKIDIMKEFEGKVALGAGRI
jgi:hypothetical protein